MLNFYSLDHVAFLWTGATDFGQDGYWSWSQSKKPIEVSPDILWHNVAIVIRNDQIVAADLCLNHNNFILHCCKGTTAEKLNYINSSPDSCRVKPISTFKVEKIETKLNGSIHSLTFPILDILK